MLNSIGALPLEIGNLTNAAFEQIFRPIEETFVHAPLIELSDTEEQRLTNFFDGLSGNATSISGSYFRMFYFSAIVQTTVGFGDIVPMTTVARAVVTAQAILGVVIIGLFLNAIAFRASRRA
jgi:hypothetical protein